MSNHTNAPDREQITKWAQEAGFTVRNGVIKVVHSNGSWVAVDDRLAEFAAIAYAEGKVAQAKCQPTMMIDNIDVVALVAAAAVWAEREACAAMLDQLEQQRDELMAALERVASADIASARWRALYMKHEAEEAITKAKGGTA